MRVPIVREFDVSTFLESLLQKDNPILSIKIVRTRDSLVDIPLLDIT